MKNILCVSLAFVALGACLSSKPLAGDDAGHNARARLNWEGVYSGLIPAADCPGIEVQLTLNPDHTFEMRYRYIDRPEGGFTQTGTFTWDTAGEVIILDDGQFPPYYRVGKDELFQLDMQGEKITGNFEDSYVLRKVPPLPVAGIF